jgi:hypothetical protein
LEPQAATASAMARLVANERNTEVVGTKVKRRMPAD